MTEGSISESLDHPHIVNGIPESTEDWEDGEEDDEHDGGEESEEDEDMDEADAEEIARRLGDQLWADISRAQADRAGAVSTVSNPIPSASPSLIPSSQDPPTPISHAPLVAPNGASKKEEAAIATMKAILAFVEKDTLARSTLGSAIVPESEGSNVLDVLTRTVAAGTVSKDVAKPLSHLLVTLARSEALFSTLRRSNAPAMQLDKGKRKREEADDACHHDYGARSVKRPFFPQYDLQAQITEAVRVITQALSTGLSDNRPLVTSSSRAGPGMNVLQEIGGLIQVVGVISGIQIAPAPGSHPSHLPPAPQPPHVFPQHSTAPWAPSQPSHATDIGTAVYPCLVPSCNKIFSRLYSLRAHQRLHAVDRPFSCTACPASFARNHDLKRHTKLHDKKAWKCCGCNKIFSRRDAIKRHKNSSRARGDKGEVCVGADVREVELDKEEREEVVKEGRRVKLWNGIVANQMGNMSSHTSYGDDPHLEDGEVRPTVIVSAQTAVMSLHPLLRSHVTKALGTPSGQVVPAPPMDPTGGQATLASVIARAQLQSLPPPHGPTSESVVSTQPSVNVDQTNGDAMSDQQTDIYGEEQEITSETPVVPSLSLYGLSDEQTKMLEEAIANAASAAQAQAEAEAALEEEEDEYDEDEIGDDQPESEEGRGEGGQDSGDSARRTNVQ